MSELSGYQVYDTNDPKKNEKKEDSNKKKKKIEKTILNLTFRI